MGRARVQAALRQVLYTFHPSLTLKEALLSFPIYRELRELRERRLLKGTCLPKVTQGQPEQSCAFSHWLVWLQGLKQLFSQSETEPS